MTSIALNVLAADLVLVRWTAIYGLHAVAGIAGRECSP